MKTFFTCLRKPSENDEALLNKINTFLSDTKNTPSQKNINIFKKKNNFLRCENQTTINQRSKVTNQ